MCPTRTPTEKYCTRWCAATLVTGRPGLFVNESYTLCLKDISAEESRPLLGFLFDWLRRPEFCYRYSWRPGHIAIWDNRATLRKAVNDYDGETRHMWRITLAGDRPEAFLPALAQQARGSRRRFAAPRHEVKLLK